MAIKKKYPSFVEAKDIVKKNNIITSSQYRERYKELGLPYVPSRTYDDDYIDWDDFCGRTKNELISYLKDKTKNKWKTYEEAKVFIHSLKLKNNKEWVNFSKSKDRPIDIPSNPTQTYKDEFISIHDWLGIKQISKYPTYEESKEIIKPLKLKSSKEYVRYVKDNNLKLPCRADYIYRDVWIDWYSYLQNEIPSIKREYLTYEDANKYVISLGLKNRDEWDDYCKSGKLPNNIPKGPHRAYKEFNEMGGIGAWLGTERVATHLRKYKTYLEASKFIHTLNLDNQTEWREYIKTNKIPIDIPNAPESTYKNKGWKDWGDWLGTGRIASQIIGKERNKEVLDFILSIESQLQNLDLTDLVVIIQQAEGGYFYERISKNIHFRNILAAQTEEDRTEAIQDLITDYSTEEYIEGDTSVLDTNTIETDVITEEETPEVEESDILQLTNHTIKQIKSLDECPITASLDEEVLEFFNKKNINELWNKYMNRELDLETYSNSYGGEFYENIKSQFLEEHYYLNSWNWQSEIKNDTYKSGKIPNLMQKLFVKRVMDNKDYGNWSGTGAGKTIGTILATKVLNCKNVIIITGNTIIDTWVKEINECFSNNNILIKEKKPILKENTTNYLIYNYEFFSQPESEGILSKILEENVIDFIALDEVQFTKQRELGEASKRKQLILKLLSIAKQKNTDIYKVAMSATPVVNNLIEAKMLLELLTLKEYNDLDTKETINNAIQIYKQLVINGIRYKPKYDIEINDIYPDINGEELIERLSHVAKGQFLEMEGVLLDLKLKSIKQYLKKGTIIYSQYVEDMVLPIKTFCESNGYRVGLFTGNDKSGLDAFKRGNCDILIGSSAIGTGVDGLQDISDNLIILSLPWTHAGYLQLLGRIYRQGSKFGSINVIIPQVNIQLDYETWSWDEIRMDRIDNKKELSDCAVDGKIPTDKIMSRETLLNKAVKALSDWKNRIEGGELLSIDRKEILFTFAKPKNRERLQKKLGDFSELNRKWSKSNSSTTKERLDKDDTEWFYYHSLYKESRKTWPEIPYLELSKKVSIRPEWIIGDFGCGENLMAKEIVNKVHAFDYVAIDESVIACDISNVPLEDNTLDVVVFSLSLMGNNYEDYLKEGYRTLKPYGQLFVCEPADKWKDREDELKQVIEGIGFRCFGAVRNSDKFIYIDGIKY